MSKSGSVTFIGNSIWKSCNIEQAFIQLMVYLAYHNYYFRDGVPRLQPTQPYGYGPDLVVLF